MIYKNIEIEWLGHAGFKIKTKEGVVIYIDPFKIADESEGADFIFITHSHYDHCSIEDIQKIAKNSTVIVCTPDSQSKFKHVNDKVKIQFADPGRQMDFPEKKVKFWAVPSYNINKKFHEKIEDWVGFIIQIGDDEENVLVYHAGDTDLIAEMKDFENIDIALLPIGGSFTMNAGEAAKAASIIKPKLAIPMHWGGIVGSKEDAEIFLRLCSGSDVDAKILEKS